MIQKFLKEFTMLREIMVQVLLIGLLKRDSSLVLLKMIRSLGSMNIIQMSVFLKETSKKEFQMDFAKCLTRQANFNLKEILRII